MRLPRAHVYLPATVLVLVGLIGRAWLVGVPAAGARAAVVAATKPEPRVLVEAADASVGVAFSAAESISSGVEQLSPDASGLVVAMCDLQLMAADTDLVLDSGQWSALASVVVRTQAIRHNYETQIAALQVIAPGKYRVEIPMYARAGDELRRQFFAELRAALGETASANVLAKLGERLEAGFAGFGVGVQTLDVAGDPTADLTEMQIARTASYWGSAEGRDRPTTRREIHFPAVEDPTGDRWDALLAMVGEASEGNGPI